MLSIMPARSVLQNRLEQQLLVQLGARLKQARLSRKMSSVELAKQLGISRTTLHAAEAGEPSPTMGTYVRILSALGMVADLALVATGKPENPASLSIESGSHIPQDLQSLLMHQEAVELIKKNPILAKRALQTLARWKAVGDPRTLPLWNQWQQIIERADWATALEDTERGRQFRQASPLSTLLPDEVRLQIIAKVKAMKERHRAAA